MVTDSLTNEKTDNKELYAVVVKNQFTRMNPKKNTVIHRDDKLKIKYRAKLDFVM